MDKKQHINFWYFVAAFAVLMLIQQWWVGSRQVETVPYSEFQNLLKDGQVSEITISDQTIRGELREPLPDGRRFIHTVRVQPDFAKDLAQYDVKFTGVVQNTFLSRMLSWVLPVLLFFAVWMFFIRKLAEKQGLGGFMTVGKSKAKIAVEKDIDVTFDDVAGVDEAKQELQEIVTFLKDPTSYGRLGARIPKGVLLVGPPGTGKTLLARAVAGESGVPFFSINGSEFVEMFVGVGAARVRDLFDQARKSAPCIIFIDELDALGRARGIAPVSGGSDEKEQTLNQLLAELDGFDPSTGVVLLAATNRPEVLDPALLRAGRFDRQILVDRPDKTGRVQILKVHMRKIAVADDVHIDHLAALTAGFSGADLANLVNEAAILATRRGGDDVTMDDFTRAIERIVAGLEKKSRILNPQERRIVAYHETGHALVTLALLGSETVHKVSIIPRGIGALGYNIQRPIEDRYLMTGDELENKMAALLGGRAAEALVFEKVSTGAADDLDKATDIARNMVMRYGMDKELGQVAYAEDQPAFLDVPATPRPQTRTYSEETASRIDDAIRKLVAQAFDRATDVLTRNRKQLDDTAAQLLDKETLTGDELPKPSTLARPSDAADPTA
ncbi:MAG: ATP-dependent zinc metalloprotease FtsH [Alphaproteobacteria bacterium]|nr:ATP-dependent zinc metalloprotease FtsH [Alphaproteobacteria bacterium]